MKQIFLIIAVVALVGCATLNEPRVTPEVVPNTPQAKAAKLSQSKPEVDAAKQALDDAWRLTQKEDYEGALQKYIWFHNNALAVSPSYYGVRLSFALLYWIELGKKYPRALAELKSIREKKTSLLVAGDLDLELFIDVGSINEHLGDSKSTAELFKRIEAANPAFASTLYMAARKSLFQAKEFELAKKYLGDPAKRLATAKRSFEQMMQFAKKQGDNEVARKGFERHFTDEVLQIITILQATGDKECAKNIQIDALKVLDNAAIRDAIKP